MDFGASLLWLEDGFCIQQLPNLEHYYGNLLASPSSFSLPLEIMHSEIHNQNLEMDHFLQLQNNRLRRSIMEEEARQRAITMQKYESRASALILQKDEEIAVARNRTRELQHFLKAAEMEATAWERAAREREAAAAELSKRLSQARERDAVSFCSSSTNTEKAIQNCKVCHAGLSCVVLFPCRHICCCRSCEPLLDHCPLCQTLKEATLQVLF
ncbi:BOI-related E3 ubiquitin-protein ligase 1-like [Salvia miltiorrhiza]|uniref:BOI-related E3 ubiquitin-protein ligase 1-like n=1 Tax=Salvia miltiorrhiza TaxID=226208 RepID=UPI0025ACCF77|nr:BOI-related E3 ubiquitin-protein ligase 1-like [Salvia miltiorrhiza]